MAVDVYHTRAEATKNFRNRVEDDCRDREVPVRAPESLEWDESEPAGDSQNCGVKYSSHGRDQLGTHNCQLVFRTVVRKHEKMDVFSVTLVAPVKTPELDVSQSSSVRYPFQVLRRVEWSGKLSKPLEDDQLCF